MSKVSTSIRLLLLTVGFIMCNWVNAQVTDVLTATSIPGLIDDYEKVDPFTCESSVVYTANIAQTFDNYIKFKYDTDAPVGLITTSSNKRLTKIKITWFSNTNTGSNLYVYANNSAYKEIADLFNASTAGTKITTFTYNKTIEQEYVFEGEYYYIGIRAGDNSKAPILSSISITYEGDNSTELQEQTIYFTSAVSTYDLAKPEDFDVPTIEGNQTTITYSSSNKDVAEVNTTTGEITAKSVGTTIVTATVAEENGYKSASASYELTVIDSETTTISGACALVAVNNAGEYYAMASISEGTTALQARKVSGVNNKVLTLNSELETIQWIITPNPTDNSLCTISPASETDKYLYANKTTSTTLSVSADKCLWKKVDGHWVFNDDNSRAFMLTTIGTPLFKNYSISDKYIHPVAMPIVDGYTRTTASGKIGTICLPYAVAVDDYSGAEFYSILGKKTDSAGKMTIVCAKETALEAGRPYLFVGKTDALVLAYSGTKVTEAKSNNGLIGALAAIGVAKGYYLVSENKIKLCGEGCAIQANRAYIDMDAVPEYTSNMAASRAIIEIGGNEGTVGIEDVDTERFVDVYSISGVLLRCKVNYSEATTGLSQGLYIVKGKKVLVR